METKAVLEWGTLVIAIYAAAIGTFNYLQERRRDQARFDVIPSIARLKSGGFRLVIEVANLSSFDILIAEMGFRLRGDVTSRVFHPSPISGHSLPIRLSPRTSVNLFVPTAAHEDSLRRLIKCIYVKTADGVLVKSNNSALKAFIQDPPTAASDEDVAQALQQWGTIITSIHGVPKGKLPGEM